MTSSTPRDFTDPTQTARAMMREITEMLADGWRSSPSTGSRLMTADAIISGGFSALHDYCDGNTLGNLCDDVADHYTEHGMRGGDDGTDPWIDHGNAAQDIVDLWLRAGMPALEGPDARYVSIEATCGKCGETFNPLDVADQIHLERADGTPCNGFARTLATIATR